MIRKLLTLLIVSFLLAAPVLSQLQVVSVTFATLSATGQTSSINVSTVGAVRHTFQVNVTGSPAGCAVQLEGSLDNSTWFDLSGSQTCTSNIMIHIVNKPVSYVRGNLTTFSGGTNPTATIRYVGVR